MRFGSPFQGNRRVVRRCWSLLLVWGVVLATSGSALAATEDMNFGRPEFPGCTRTMLTPPVVYDTDPDNVELDRKVTISPPVFESPVLEPGERFVCVVEIHSRYDRRATFELRTVGIRGSHSSRASATFLDEEDPDAANTAASWLEPVVDEVTLDPRGVAEVPVVVTIPDDPPVGSAFGALDIVAKSTETGPGDTNLGIETHVLASFLLAVGGEGRPKYELGDVRAPKLRWNRDPWTLRANLDNDGTLHAVPRGRVRIRSLFGNVVNELKVADLPLLPGGRARIDRTWDDVPWFGVYRWDLVVNDGDPVRTDESVRTEGWFVALPPWWVLAIAAAVIVFALVARRVRRRHQRAWDDGDQDSFEDIES